MINALITYIIASTGVFFQHNIQYIYPWWRNKDLINVLIFSIPVGYFYLKSWTYFTDASGSVWNTRFIFFGLSYLVFPINSYFFMGESPFTLKTLICTLLSLLIILVQYKL